MRKKREASQQVESVWSKTNYYCVYIVVTTIDWANGITGKNNDSKRNSMRAIQLVKNVYVHLSLLIVWLGLNPITHYTAHLFELKLINLLHSDYFIITSLSPFAFFSFSFSITSFNNNLLHHITPFNPSDNFFLSLLLLMFFRWFFCFSFFWIPHRFWCNSLISLLIFSLIILYWFLFEIHFLNALFFKEHFHTTFRNPSW